MAKEHLLNYQLEKRGCTAHAVMLAIRSPDAEIHAGSLDPSVVTKRLIADRAGIGRSSLRKSSQRETRELVEKWLGSLKKPSEPAAQVKGKASFPDLARQLDCAFLEIEMLKATQIALAKDDRELRSKLARAERELSEVRHTPYLKSI